MRDNASTIRALRDEREREAAEIVEAAEWVGAQLVSITEPPLSWRTRFLLEHQHTRAPASQGVLSEVLAMSDTCLARLRYLTEPGRLRALVVMEQFMRRHPAVRAQVWL